MLSNQVDIKLNYKNRLILERSAVKALVELIALSAFCALWYWILLTKAPLFETEGEPRSKLEGIFISLFYFAPLMFYRRLYLCITTLVTGNRYIFCRTSGIVRQNNRVICRMDQIEKVSVLRETDSESADTFILEVVHSGGRYWFIAESDDRYYIYNLADEIAKICEIKTDFVFK